MAIHEGSFDSYTKELVIELRETVTYLSLSTEVDFGALTGIAIMISFFHVVDLAYCPEDPFFPRISA